MPQTQTCWYCRKELAREYEIKHAIHRACYAEMMDRKHYGEGFATPIADAADSLVEEVL
jgi:hypothetical protein